MNKNSEQKLINFGNTIANIDFDAIRENDYKLDREQNPNNYSYWYPKVRNLGMRIANSKYHIIPLDVYKSLVSNLDSPEKQEEFAKYIKSILENWGVKSYEMYSVKNGCYSDKFSNCNVMGKDIPEKFTTIEYFSSCYETGGLTEFVIRELIPYDDTKTPTIYRGLPLRPEFRVFVDFDTKKILYIVNYWDYDYCYPHLDNLTDKIVFDYSREFLESEFEKSKGAVLNEVQKIVNNNTELKGQWSIDVLKDEKGDYWLIDMALAHRSAYYDYDKCHENNTTN